MKVTIEEKVGRYIVCNNLDSDSRKQEYVYKRHYLCKYLRKNTDLSFSKIGKMFDKDHATIIHSIKQFENLKTDDRFYSKVVDLLQEFPLNLTHKYEIEVGLVKLPAITFNKINNRLTKGNYKSHKDVIIEMLING